MGNRKAYLGHQLIRLYGVTQVLEDGLHEGRSGWVSVLVLQDVAEDALDGLSQVTDRVLEDHHCHLLCGLLGVVVLHHVIIVAEEVGNRKAYQSLPSF